MVTVRTENLTIRLGEFHLQRINLHVQAGEHFVLLGPTGAGKTVLIECIAGMHHPQSGNVFLDDEDVTTKRLEERGIGYVPQDYALFPNMTVENNIAFGLRIRKASAEEVAQRVKELTDLLHIDSLLQRYPLTLSGGEKQRVALARALAVRPRLLLLDEPLAAVDESTRDRLCGELKEIQRHTGVTVIHVSHNFEETLAVADSVGILHNGHLLHTGKPEDVFYRPQSRFVAEFTRAENIFAIDTVEPHPDARTAVVLADEERLQLSVDTANGELPPSPTCAVIRPERVRLKMSSPESEIAPSNNCFVARVREVTNKGALLRVETATDDGTRWVALVPVSLSADLLLQRGQSVEIGIDSSDIHLL
ncbi:MAG: hypothetical protein AUJ92_16280 [Armatimonadetes bacterium CG2_30_59_28]|nr:ATP-binding cassette domain-containing protein [Armatimonadota bacterium]OIO91556.1 MAG: hypothetical protein AUJ92_16280 [Armatimonadetes bacterium CG2_30_59_28]PIU64003.1 MAG: hypothetical protein COS85_14160 [Armatimonadetes bacterium CG07_land_8_20_14_0_80_59_28]PIY43003.1 MAG: hypothetical protein COZ05_12465 [Armatimonadetes bacterium CG_4_10_14_3_um_filter_59_10]